VRLSPLGTSATVGLLYQPRMIDDDVYGAVGGMRIGRGNRRTRRKPAPVPLCPPQIPHDLTWDRTRAAAYIRLSSDRFLSNVFHFILRLTYALIIEIMSFNKLRHKYMGLRSDL
jgi:hypothetical protein